MAILQHPELHNPNVQISPLRLGIMEFINKLPNGFDTFLGENGATLSGGQSQRIALARALYKDHEILILDEPSSSLDFRAEQFVRDVMISENALGKTVILISHRLSTVTQAHKIVILSDGKVAEEGSHSDLLEAKGAYYKLWQREI